MGDSSSNGRPTPPAPSRDLAALAVNVPALPYLFEVAWEVCNQVGGIYQVIRSKAPQMIERWGDRYFLVGPYEKAKADLEFEPSRPVGFVAQAIQALKDQGITVHHGRWLVSGRPRVLLIEHGMSAHDLDVAKFRLWSEHGIESPTGDGLIDGVITFADRCERLMRALVEARDASMRGAKASSAGAGAGAGGSGSAAAGSAPIIGHFHEWMGGLAIPMLRRAGLPIATVFTTHATLLGRYIASNTENFYDILPFLDDRAEAARYNVRTQHAIERACAHGAHVFTTVSSITAEECASLLGRKVDLILPNGLNISRYNAVHDQQRLHGEFKEAIHRFTCGHFFPSYSFDLDKTLYFFTSGRFEPANKGFDLCLEAMARLNAEMKAANLGKTVVFFIISKRPTRSLNPLCMEKRGVLNELSEVCKEITDGVHEKLFWRAAAGGRLVLDDLVDEYWMLRYRRAQHALKQHCLPVVVTHILEDDATDPVLNHLRTLGLVNKPEDPVKVVYSPDFITPTNRLWGIEYDQFVRGCHLGIFPSRYEPWGYTPLECLAMGVPAMTSDLAGFGRYVHETYPDHDHWGMTVLNRRGRGYHEAAADMAWRLLNFCKMDRRERIALRNEVDRHSWDFDWAKLGTAYHQAHDLALERATWHLGAAEPARV